MTELQEPKYGVEDGSIINRATGKAIERNEPILIFRAQDRKALVALEAYAAACEDAVHRGAVEERIAEFRRFSQEHPERMKEPDTETA